MLAIVGNSRGGCVCGRHRASGRAHWLLHAARRDTSSAAVLSGAAMLSHTRSYASNCSRCLADAAFAWVLAKADCFSKRGQWPSFCDVRSQLGWVSSVHGQRLLVDNSLRMNSVHTHGILAQLPDFVLPRVAERFAPADV